MVTIGTAGTCQRCGQAGMEGEERNFSERAECPNCGLYYEITFVPWIALEYVPEPVTAHTPQWSRLLDLLRADGWHITGERCYRVGVIKRPFSVTPHFDIINSWFTIPTPLLQRGTPTPDADGDVAPSAGEIAAHVVQWFTFDGEPTPPFKREQWYVEASDSA